MYHRAQTQESAPPDTMLRITLGADFCLLRSVSDGDIKAMEVNEDFLSCIAYSIPPMSGPGMGIDRLIDATSLRKAAPLPLMKPK